jgi:hypothetical protein
MPQALIESFHAADEKNVGEEEKASQDLERLVEQLASEGSNPA